MTQLSVNVNKIALLRNQRDLDIPSVTGAARICLDAGAAGITVHPRPDQRHIRPSDVRELAEMLSQWPRAEFNIEGNPFAGTLADYPGFMAILRETRPTQATLVPDTAGQATSDHGWDLAADGERLAPLVSQLKDLGIRVSVFMDADPALMARAAEIGADRVELYTEPYAAAFTRGDADAALASFAAAADAVTAAGLGINAGHDLNLRNLGSFCAAVSGVLEVSIGHALTAEALEMGLQRTVKAYLAVLAES